MGEQTPAKTVTKVALVGSYAEVLEMFSALGVAPDYFLVGEANHPLEEGHIFRYCGHHNGTAEKSRYDEVIELSTDHGVTLI